MRIGLFTGQVGYAWNNVLWYVKGGAAVTDDKYSGFFTGPGVACSTTASETRWGGTVGPASNSASRRTGRSAFEYDHLFMGNRNVTFPAIGDCASRAPTTSARTSTWARSAINYRFGGPVVARY